ncbi:HpcH/HpaI aldolase/citrate lyase family protein [Ensifer sp. YR511]|uniref:HpcH/HpaI aldolase family protein n=1 Tax=Ensifer sp. YR511 TaxID=1855294 RepID=UPI0008803B1C|nr:aldolase/citrate lyase family protein [Ensifer sp. YR511]SDN75827.1 2-keto-3-deoxy-L-rhamnonate aldolase RhmA [Ensifer sp. YR511]
MMINTAKQELQKGNIALGYQIRTQRSIEVVMMAKAFGYHFIYIDLEHGSMDLDVAAQLCLACVSEKITSFVRVPTNSLDIATRLLDYGAQGIIVPHVNTADQARYIVETLRFPPYGSLSEYGGSFTRWAPMTKYERMKIKNENVLISVSMETVEALDNVEEIASVAGIDVISVGSNDLSVEMGIPQNDDHPDLIEAYGKVVAAAKKHGKFVRLGGVYTEAFFPKALNWGTQLLVLSGDRNIEDDMRSKIANYKKAFPA